MYDNAFWGKGSLCHHDEKVEKAALEACYESIDIAREISFPFIALWLGTDGFDYPFQTEYKNTWNNLGVTVDFGHALMARENAAEVHINDCYGDWDDDLIVGSVRVWEALDLLYKEVIK